MLVMFLVWLAYTYEVEVIVTLFHSPAFIATATLGYVYQCVIEYNRMRAFRRALIIEQVIHDNMHLLDAHKCR